MTLERSTQLWIEAEDPGKKKRDMFEKHNAVNSKINKLDSFVAHQHFNLEELASQVVQLSQDESKLLDDPEELAGLVFDTKPSESGRPAVRAGPVDKLVFYLTYFRQPGTILKSPVDSKEGF